MLGRFRHRFSCRLTGRQPWKWRDVVWIYPLMDDEMTEAVMQKVVIYVSRRQNTVVQ